MHLCKYLDTGISIHALLAESDPQKGRAGVSQRKFLSTLSLRRATFTMPDLCQRYVGFLSTLSLRRATKPNKHQNQPRRFLSTLSLRRATSNKSGEDADNSNFYPRSPCGERPQNLGVSIIQLIFLSTLSLRRATNGIRLIEHIGGFLSTLSLRRATRKQRGPPA